MNRKTFLYAEFQVSVPFEKVDWPSANEVMKQIPGLKVKTWLSGVNTHSIGGFYEFDSVDNARAYAEGALADFAKQAGGSLTTKIFDGEVVRAASLDMASPHYVL